MIFRGNFDKLLKRFGLTTEHIYFKFIIKIYFYYF